MKFPASSGSVRRLALLCLALFVAMSGAGISLVRLEQSQRQATSEKLLVGEAAEIRAAIGDELSQSIALARGLRAYVISHPDLGDPERFAVLLEQLHQQGEHIRNIGVAPDNVLTHVWPLEGNESAIGMRYEDVPSQFEAVSLAMETRESVLAGPVDLVQGGRGLIDRTPVYLEDGSHWGMVSLVLDVDSMIASVEASLDQSDLTWSIRTVGTDDEPPTMVSGDPDVFGQADTVLDLAVPNGTWQLAVRSESEGRDTRTLVLALCAIAVSGMLARLIFDATRERWRSTRLAQHDDLTGLANRRLLQTRATASLDSGDEVSLAFFDLDGFKPINDLHGHEAGDEVLREVARRLTSRCRESDTVARVGGDEFVVLAPKTPVAGARFLVDELAELIARPIHVKGLELQVGASSGVATGRGDSEDFEQLLARADQAMYAAKQRRQDRMRSERRPLSGATQA